MKNTMKPLERGVFAILRTLALSVPFVASASAAEKLGAFPVDPAQISVAGISSGAFMANQIHIAHSADVMGRGDDRRRPLRLRGAERRV